MTTSEPLALDGCAPTPLASYLKALGILRLLSSPANNVTGEAADPRVRGWWANERFHLRATLNRDAVLRFFLDEYAPSPIIAPWNGGSGFYPNDNKDGFDPLTSETVAKRFEPIALAIQGASRVIAVRVLSERPEGDAKIEFVAALRAELPDAALAWIDAALALSGESLTYPPLLGSGGNDGRLDFTSNFMRRLVSKKRPTGLFDASSGAPSSNARPLLASALFDTPSQGLSSAAVGQFAPGAAGGPNATTGYEAGGAVNPWNFVLMLEGSVAFAGAATRRHQSLAGFGASFPFTVRTVGAGWGGVEAADEHDARAEFWAPLWSRPARFSEIDTLLAEGRAVLNGRTARDGLDFARAAASLGVSRGFSAFERFGFFMRAGRTYLATPIGRRSAAPSPGAQLIADLDAGGWLDRVRRVGRNDEEPAAARNAIKQLEDALFGLVVPVVPSDRVERALVALGKVVDWLAVSPNGRQAVGTPPPLLSPAWMRQADDGSAEFRVAVALAGLGLPAPGHSGHFASEQTGEDAEDEHATASVAEVREATAGQGSQSRSNAAPPMAAHFAPIEEKRFFNGQHLQGRRVWSSDASSPTVVWGAGGLVSNMIAVLERRLVEATTRELADKPLAGAANARLADVVAFLSDSFDDARCAALLGGLVWARPTWLPGKRPSGRGSSTALPFAFAALKPVFVPDEALGRAGARAGTAHIPVPPGLIARLRAGGDSLDGRVTDEAVRMALARVRTSGLPSPFDPVCSGARGAGFESGRIGAGVRADRLAAALLIPVSDKALDNLLTRAYPDALPDDSELTEDTNDAT